MITKLSADELKRTVSPERLSFSSTDEIRAHTGMIGQRRAEAALAFGLRIKKKGYNIYVSGYPGSGRTTFSRAFACQAANEMPAPPDLCYIYNFTEPKSPKLLKLCPGMGKVFKKDIDEFIARLQIELPKALSSRDFEEEKGRVVREYKDCCDELIKHITNEAKKEDFGAKMTGGGIYFMPLVDGEMISEEKYEELSEEEKAKIAKQSDKISQHAAEIMAQIREGEKAARVVVENLEYRTSLFSVGRLMSPLYDAYSEQESVIDHLNDIKEDILENIESFFPGEPEEDNIQSVIPWMQKKEPEDIFSKYRVNLLVDNSGLDSAPVLVEFSPNYSDLIGEVEYDSEYGNFTTDFMKIKPGLLHKGNGGFLILQTADLFSIPHVYEALKKALKTKKIIIEPMREMLTGVAMAGVTPQAAPLDIKLILVGTHYMYEVLSEYDDDFEKLFKVNAVFDYEMDFCEKNIDEISGFVRKYAEEHETLPFDASAVAKMVEYSTRLSGSQKKLTAQLSKLTEVLVESASWAEIDKAPVITEYYVKKAIDEKNNRNSLYEDKLSEMIEDNMIMIDTEGVKIGQVNGLAVLSTGDYTFGKPSKITATSYVGKAGIINIEKEAEMSGAIHNKGVQVLTGYLGQTYAQEFPLALSARICFEQNYNGIDGDSASSTELYAILSSLSGLPITQEIAVTGSINQRGEIQPIGGVTWKIEGFFDLCEARKLTGRQGVIIPRQNISDLVLKDSVINAVERGMFNIYAIDHIDEGIEILTGTEAGALNDKLKYPPESVHGLVMKKLRDFHKVTSK